jgi:small subunit ribosomal protein S16
MGRKKRPHYRVVVADSQSPRDGRFVETLGYYKPLTDPARLVIDLDRVDHWLSQGAEPSGTVRSLISKARRGGSKNVAVGIEDEEEVKAKRAEALAAKRAAEKKAVQADAKAAADAEAAVAAEAAAVEEAEAEAAVGAEAEAPEGTEAAAADATDAAADDGAEAAAEDGGAGEGEAKSE